MDCKSNLGKNSFWSRADAYLLGVEAGPLFEVQKGVEALGSVRGGEVDEGITKVAQVLEVNRKVEEVILRPRTGLCVLDDDIA